MCSSPSPPPPPPERQSQQAPKDAYDKFTGLNAKRRRGLWSSIMTSPQGIMGAPMTTGTSGGIIGG
jgi:hypothetical protein